MDIKTKQINAIVSDVTPDSLTAWASVELADMEGDIIRINGIDTSYHTSNSPVKIFPEHTYTLEDGKPAVIGRVESLEKTTHPTLNVPALKFTMSWAKDADGSLSDLAKAYKELYDSKYMDSFSIGVQKIDGNKIEGGADWTETKLVEISAAAIPANQYANVIKALKRHNIRIKDMSDLNIGHANPTALQGDYGTYKKDMSDMMEASMSKCMDHVTKSHKDMGDMMQAHISKCIDGMCKSINERFDDIESAISVADDGPKPVVSKSLSDKDLEAKKLQDEALAKLSEQLADLRKAFNANK